MNIFTIAHAQDQEAVTLQRRSLVKFGTNYQHYVIWEDRWPGLPKHWTGWVRQQAIKLLVGINVVEDRYMVLDAKNFLCKPVDFDAWPIESGSGLCDPWAEEPQDFDSYSQFIARATGQPRPALCHATVTPYVLRTSIVKTICQDPRFFSWFEHDLPSEFVLYNHWARPTEIEDRAQHHTLWPDSGNMEPESFDAFMANPMIKIFGMHRDYDDARSRVIVYKWLREQGLLIPAPSETSEEGFKTAVMHLKG